MEWHFPGQLTLELSVHKNNPYLVFFHTLSSSLTNKVVMLSWGNSQSRERINDLSNRTYELKVTKCVVLFQSLITKLAKGRPRLTVDQRSAYFSCAQAGLHFPACSSVSAVSGQHHSKWNMKRSKSTTSRSGLETPIKKSSIHWLEKVLKSQN